MSPSTKTISNFTPPLTLLPLAFSSGAGAGAGAGAQHAIGRGLIGGMLTGTFLTIFFVPLFFIGVKMVFKWSVGAEDLNDGSEGNLAQH